ncbi:MAG: hypothetical protein KA142_01165 [Chromatiaceae bacterium]|nr:hypothetical protein [Chromatiaceae bacterium]
MAKSQHHPAGLSAGLFVALALVNPFLGGATQAATPQAAVTPPGRAITSSAASDHPAPAGAVVGVSSAPATETPVAPPAPTVEPAPAAPAAMPQTNFAVPPDADALATTATPDNPLPAKLPDDPKSLALVERIQAMWAAKIKRDYAGAYEFETPDYRAKLSTEAYPRQFGGGVNWHGIEVVDIKYNDEHHVTVGILLDYTHLHPFTDQEVRAKSFLREHWTEVSDQWYHEVPLHAPLGDLTAASPQGSAGPDSAPKGEQEKTAP